MNRGRQGPWHTSGEAGSGWNRRANQHREPGGRGHGALVDVLRVSRFSQGKRKQGDALKRRRVGKVFQLCAEREVLVTLENGSLMDKTRSAADARVKPGPLRVL